MQVSVTGSGPLPFGALSGADSELVDAAVANKIMAATQNACM
jgi:hypothetical protein